MSKDGDVRLVTIGAFDNMCARHSSHIFGSSFLAIRCSRHFVNFCTAVLSPLALGRCGAIEVAHMLMSASHLGAVFLSPPPGSDARYFPITSEWRHSLKNNVIVILPSSQRDARPSSDGERGTARGLNCAMSKTQLSRNEGRREGGRLVSAGARPVPVRRAAAA